MVGVSGEIAARLPLEMASARTDPCCTDAITDGALAKAEFDMAADHVRDRLRRALVGHMRDSDVGLELSASRRAGD